MQLGANPPCSISVPQPGQTAPVPMPACAGPCICAAMAALDTTWPASPSPKARSSMTTRNRLTEEPNMPDQHKTGSESCQAIRMPASVTSPSVASGTRRALADPLSRWRSICSGSPCSAAFWCRVLPVLLFVSAYGLDTPRGFADTSNEAPGSSRTQDHVHVTVRRAGDAFLITLRTDPGYQINANPASDDYLIPTTVVFAGSVPERIVYPPATPFKPAFADAPINVYEGTVVVTATFAPGALDRTHELGFTVTAQACTKEICLPPDDITARATW